MACKDVSIMTEIELLIGEQHMICTFQFGQAPNNAVYNIEHHSNGYLYMTSNNQMTFNNVDHCTEFCTHDPKYREAVYGSHEHLNKITTLNVLYLQRIMTEHVEKDKNVKFVMSTQGGDTNLLLQSARLQDRIYSNNKS
jgi:hypothetical protein